MPQRVDGLTRIRKIPEIANVGMVPGPNIVGPDVCWGRDARKSLFWDRSRGVSGVAGVPLRWQRSA